MDIGSTVGGRYRLVELIGTSTVAAVYRGRDAQLERDVAVKLYWSGSRRPVTTASRMAERPPPPMIAPPASSSP